MRILGKGPEIDTDVEADEDVEFEVKFDKKKLREMQKAAEERRENRRDKILQGFWIALIALQLLLALLHSRM